MREAKMCVFAAMMLISLPLYAQWDLGGILNVGITSISIDPPGQPDYSNKLGFGIGAIVDRRLTKTIDLHAEPMYLQKGAKIKSRTPLPPRLSDAEKAAHEAFLDELGDRSLWRRG